MQLHIDDPPIWLTSGELVRFKVTDGGGLMGDSQVDHHQVVRAAAIWNNQANGNSFSYDGTTTAGYSDVPRDKSDCDQQGIDFSVVELGTTGGNGQTGRWEPRCIDANGDAHHFRIKINATNGNGSLNWGVGNFGVSQVPLLRVLTHEFGHAAGLGHSTNGTPAVMETTGTATAVGEDWWHDLYNWDMVCLTQFAADRDTTGRVDVRNSGASTQTIGYGLGKGTAYVSEYNPGLTPYELAYVADDVYWNDILSTSTPVGLLGLGQRFGIEPRGAVWPEDPSSPSADRVLVPSYIELGAGEQLLHPVLHFYSTSEYSSFSSTYLQSCATMSSWMTCSSQQYVNTGKRLSVAYDSRIGQSHTAWVNQNRAGNDLMDAVYVSTGVASSTGGFLPTPNTLPSTGPEPWARSEVAVGIACKSSFISGTNFNCLLAHVPIEDPVDGRSAGRIRVKRFRADAGTNRYDLAVDSADSTVFPAPNAAHTAADLDMYYHDGYFYLVVKPQQFTEPWVDVYRSNDGVVWSTAYLLGRSASSPSATADQVNELITRWEP